MDAALTAARRADVVARRGAAPQTMMRTVVGAADREPRRGGSGSTGMPGSTPAAATRSQPTDPPRTRRPHGSARQRPATPTRTLGHAAGSGPHCATRRVGGWEQRRRAVVALPVAAAEVVAHVVLSRRRPVCDRRIVPAVDWGAVVVGRQRFSARRVRRTP